METVRLAHETDKEDFKKLWSMCFGDSFEFINWFFENRFIANYSICLKQNKNFISCMQSYPMDINIRGKLVKGAMLCGVCTHPEYRGKGFMKDVFTYMMRFLYKEHMILAVHTPAILESYYFFGHYPVSDACYLTADYIPFYEKLDNIKEVQIEEYSKIYLCYYQFANLYSGIIHRTKDDFLLKWKDYQADGGRCIAYISDDIVKGYCFFYLTEATIQAVEVVADTEESFVYVLKGLFSYGEGKKLHVKLPSKYCSIQFDFTKTSVIPKGVAGVINISSLLETVSCGTGYAIKVVDPIIPENNGIFDLEGNRINQDPDIEIEAGRLTQLLVGYVTLKDLIKQNQVKVLRQKAVEELHELFPIAECYIVDEY